MIDLEQLLVMKPLVHEIRLKPIPDEDFPYHLIPNGVNYPWREGRVQQIFYEWDGKVIWGLMARILAHFLEIIRKG